jgi:membrane glycosyltransferase
MAVLTSQIELGTAFRNRRFLLIPEESWSPAVLRRAWLHARRLSRPALVAA